MTTVNKPLSLLYFCLGLSCGLVIGVSLDKGWSVTLTKFIPAIVIVVLALFAHRIESVAHRHFLDTWPNWRARGKWRFILTNYVVIRGMILFLAVSAPMLPAIELTKYTVGIIGASVVALAVLMIYLGHEEWTKCEEDYQIQLFRQAAEQSRIAGN